eukprot:g772.t1
MKAQQALQARNRDLEKAVEAAHGEARAWMSENLAKNSAALSSVNELCRGSLRRMKVANEDLAAFSLELADQSLHIPAFLSSDPSSWPDNTMINEKNHTNAVERWEVAAAAHSSFSRHEGLYEKYLALEFQISDEIEKDIKRTFPGRDDFAEDKLRNVLHAYNLHDPKHTYAQGMNFIAGYLLLSTKGDEQRSFWLLVHLMQDRVYNLRDLFNDDSKLKVRHHQINVLLEERMPKLNLHFRQLDIGPHQWFSSWALTLFAGSAPPGPQLESIFDLIFEHGWPAIFSIALGALFHSQQRLLMCNMEDCQKFLKREIWNEVVDIATAIKSAGKVAAVTAKQLDSKELEYLLRNS